MGFDYKLTENAGKDLEEIAHYISVTLGSRSAATAFADEFEATMGQVCLFPESGSKVVNEYLSAVESANVRKVVIKNYVLFYEIDCKKERILVLRIVYGRRNMEDVLNHLGG